MFYISVVIRETHTEATIKFHFIPTRSKNLSATIKIQSNKNANTLLVKTNWQTMFLSNLVISSICTPAIPL